jgi:hypothetical protein
MLDPQLVCYSWITGIVDVAQVVFVRKRLVEIQYFQATITDAQREESANWWRKRSDESRHPSSYRTAASGPPRIRA